MPIRIPNDLPAVKTLQGENNSGYTPFKNTSFEPDA